MYFDLATATDLGRRKNNEDSSLLEPGLGLVVVADGMGGYEGGEVASSLAVEAVARFLARERRDPSGTWPCAADRTRRYDENLLVASLERAHLDIVARRQGALADMGSTVVALLLRADVVTVAHVGDSRAYRLREGRLEALTRDHSVQAEMAAAGVAFPFRNYVTRALGVDAHRADVSSHALAPGDVLLLCTDGLSEALDEPAIAALLQAQEAREAALKLVRTAVDAGAQDNVTVAVVRALQSSPSPS
jgi:serine/threonine protein phosphatase PrpC